MDEAAVAVLEEEREENVVCQDDGAFGNNQASAESHHKRDGVFCCQKCGEAYREESAYLKHLQQHSQGDNSMCLETQLNDKDDVVTHHETPSHDFSPHVDTVHSQMIPKDSAVQMNSGIKQQHTYQCEECGKSYGVLGHFLNHQRSHRQASKSVFHDLEHLKKKSFQCEFCGRSYSRASALDAHRRCHEEKLIKRCRSTLESVSTEQRVDDIKSMENHTEEAEKTLDTEKTFECSCGKSFATLLRLKTHQRFSRNNLCSPEEMLEKPKKSVDFKCSHCNKTFSGQIALINHERWHTHDDAVKKFPCEECGKVFMTLTFYYRHQRIAHSKETASKSFLHQVCQLQKKSFECKDCGLKFSRASALHSHELHHTDVFKETEKEARVSATLLPQQNHHRNLKCESKAAENTEDFENRFPTSFVSDHHLSDTEDDLESFEPGDLIVKVISSSESEDDTEQDTNSDLELVCESDHDVKEDGDMAIHHKVVSKSHMDLKIVQIDYGEPLPPVVESDNKPIEERYDCPDCYRWFTSPTSLRVHRMWHGVRKRRQLAQVGNNASLTKHPHRHVLDKVEKGNRMQTATEVNEDISDTGVDTGGDASESDMTASSQMDEAEMENLRKVYACNLCGKMYTYLVSYKKHQEMHEYESKKKGPKNPSMSDSKKYECPDCGCAFLRQARLISHLKHHKMRSSNRRCDQCNKTFASASSWIGHLKLHELRPFWCFSCAKGFTDQCVFSKHMHMHKCKQFTCTICHKSFLFLRQLNDHYNLHTGAKPHICAFCGKGFSTSGTLHAHRKKHRKVNFGYSTSKAGLKSVWVKKKLIRCINNHERGQLETNLQRLSGASENKMTPQNICDSGQVSYQKTDTPKYTHWEWECCECDLGFHEVTQLHRHYIQHATGEIPMGLDRWGM